MKGYFYIFICLGMLLSLHFVMAQDVFFYTSGNYVPVMSVKNVSCIVFNSEKLTIKSTEGTICNLPYEKFNYFRFYETPIPAAIKTVNKDDTCIHFDGKKIKIKTQQKINAVEVINSSAVIVENHIPQGNSFQYDMTNLPSGVYIVKVLIGDKKYMEKFLIQ